MTATLQRQRSDLTALGKAAAILDAIADGEKPLAQIAAITDLPLSTVHRILQELAAIGWARQTDRGRYTTSNQTPPTSTPTVREVTVAGDALHAWCTRRGMPGGWIDRLGPHGAARHALEALRQAGVR